MTETTELFIVLAAIYFAECVGRAPRDAVVFLPRLGRGWRFLTGTSLYGNPRWGLFLGNPLPEYGSPIVSELWPVSLSPTGICSHGVQAFNPGGPHEQPGRFLRYEAIKTAEPASRALLINGERFVETASPILARRLAELIRSLARLPEDRRSAAIDAYLRETLDTRAIRQRTDEFDAASRWLGMVCTTLFVHLFAACPLAAWQYGLAMIWLPLLIVMLALDLLALVLFHRAHRRLYLRWTSERWSNVATMLLMPLAAVRAPAALARHLLALYHPLGAARVLCVEADFIAMASAMLRDLDFPVRSSDASLDPAAEQTRVEFHGRVAAAIERWLVHEGFDPAGLRAPPPRDGEDHVSYCPRCHCQFIISTGLCEACALPLATWPVAESARSAP